MFSSSIKTLTIEANVLVSIVEIQVDGKVPTLAIYIDWPYLLVRVEEEVLSTFPFWKFNRDIARGVERPPPSVFGANALISGLLRVGCVIDGLMKY